MINEGRKGNMDTLLLTSRGHICYFALDLRIPKSGFGTYINNYFLIKQLQK